MCTLQRVLGARKQICNLSAISNITTVKKYLKKTIIVKPNKAIAANFYAHTGVFYSLGVTVTFLVVISWNQPISWNNMRMSYIIIYCDIRIRYIWKYARTLPKPVEICIFEKWKLETRNICFWGKELAVTLHYPGRCLKIQTDKCKYFLN